MFGSSSNDSASFWLDKVEKDVECQARLKSLQTFCREAVQQALPKIKENLKKHQGNLQIDVLWRGCGYNGPACGGQYDVLMELQDVLKVGRIMGASGGACSAIFCLSSNNSQVMIKSYMAYVLWKQHHWWKTEILQAPPLWTNLYAASIGTDQSFQNLQTKGWVAFRSGYTNTVLHNFATRNQCVQAYTASGELSANGLLRGIQIDGISKRCCDGGFMSTFPPSANDTKKSPMLLYYHGLTSYPYVTSCSMESIDFLYRQGVTETLQMLASPNFQREADVPFNGESTKKMGGMCMFSTTDNGSGDNVSSSYLADLQSVQSKTTFVDGSNPSET